MKQYLINHSKGLSAKLMKYPRDWYHKKLAKRNNNSSPTIICNNCTGGVILHDLGLRFNSPTINTLFYSFDDFLFFVKNIKAFSNVEMFEIKQDTHSYPVGGLELNGKVIKIGLVHYRSFLQGKLKWHERFKRIRYNNIYIIYEGGGIEEKCLNDFTKIPFKKRIYSCTNSYMQNKFAFYQGHDLYFNWYPGKILDYKHLLGLKRFLDDFNYISFLNT